MSSPGRARVRYEKKEHVAYVTLDRPEVLNAMDMRMHSIKAAPQLNTTLVSRGQEFLRCAR